MIMNSAESSNNDANDFANNDDLAAEAATEDSLAKDNSIDQDNTNMITGGPLGTDFSANEMSGDDTLEALKSDEASLENDSGTQMSSSNDDEKGNTFLYG
ncbi:3516_t:CDS:1 [Ambispora leptoticha]|uniref:3516_t:CDS:1 n=1 Tax=Ambispora leptoticha TaxID=144679 RepID=A0A9N9B0T7_9GLOM|nr:3516_t:CDS:1 [Ambispora leptoticha]